MPPAGIHAPITLVNSGILHLERHCCAFTGSIFAAIRHPEQVGLVAKTAVLHAGDIADGGTTSPAVAAPPKLPLGPLAAAPGPPAPLQLPLEPPAGIPPLVVFQFPLGVSPTVGSVSRAGHVPCPLALGSLDTVGSLCAPIIEAPSTSRKANFILHVHDAFVTLSERELSNTKKNLCVVRVYIRVFVRVCVCM